MSNDPWAAANAAQTGASADGQGESRQDAYQGSGNGQSRLFGSEGGAPSLFNKSHKVGTKRSGIITKAPYDQQRTKMGSGEPLFWQAGEKSPVTAPVNPHTGQKNRPVNDTVIEISTDYAMDAEEAALTNRETPYDGGARRVFVGKELKAFKDAISKAVEGGMRLTCDADLVGKKLTVERTGMKPNPNGGDPIKIHSFLIENA